MPCALGGPAADDGHLGAGVEDELDRPAAVDAALDDDLVADDAERNPMHLTRHGLVHGERRAALERARGTGPARA